MSETFWVIPTINSPNYKKFRTKAIHSSNTSTQKRGARNSRMGTRPLLSIVKHDKLYRVYGFVMRKGGSTLYSRAQLKNSKTKPPKKWNKKQKQEINFASTINALYYTMIRFSRTKLLLIPPPRTHQTVIKRFFSDPSQPIYNHYHPSFNPPTNRHTTEP